MPVLVTPLFWEWFNIWLIQFLKNLYHEIKMVALRGGNSSLGTVSHGCGIHAGQQNALDLTHRLQTSLGMQHSASTQAVGHHASHLNHANHASHNNHINHANHAGPGSQLNIPSLSSMSLLMQQQTPATLKHEQNTRYSNSNCMLPSHHYRLLAQTRPECYHPSGAASGAYMSGATGGQSSAQSMRGQPAPQPSAPPAPQQDISKTTMAGPSYVSPQNQTPPSRPQYPNFQYRATQHGNRPSSHPRQQQPYMSGASASAAGPVMYHPTLMFPPHMGIPQTYQQPRSSTPGFYSYVPQYISYTTPTGPTTPYYYPSNGQQLAAGSVGGAGGRANSAALVPQQPNAPTASNALPHSQPQPHIHPSIPGIRQVPPKRTSHRLAIINPLTKQDIFSEIHSNDSQYMSGESSERQTPQLEQPHNFAEEFSRMVNEAANQPSPCESAMPVPVTAALPATAPATTATSTLVSSSSSLAHSMPAPQPQRIREPRERVRSEDKEKPPPPKIKDVIEKEIPKPNGPTSVEISSVDSLLDAINPSTSQVTQNLVKETTKAAKPLSVTNETELSNIDNNPEVVINREPTFPVKTSPTATELLSASIEKVAKEQPLPEETPVKKEESIAIQAQVKLTQSIASVARNHPESKMKDINLNNNTTAIILDPDTANGNPSEVNKVETVKDEGNKNEKAIKNSKNNNKKSNKMASNEVNINKTESYENGKDETDKVSTEPEKLSKEEEEENSPEVEKPTPAPASSEPTVFVPKYKYSEDQWSPLNKSGKKYYDIGLLMQIKDDPLSKNKPNVPLLESLNVMRSPIQETVTFNPISRPMNDALFPNFLKNSGVGSRSNAPREPKKDGRIMPQSGKGSVKLTPSSSGSSSHKPVIHVSLSLREEVKLNQTKDAWRPTRFKKDNLTEEEFKTQDLYKKFRGILNKLTPQKFDTLLDKVKTLEINTQARLEGVIDLVFEKAIDEPNFSEAYAAMCSKLSMLKVPADNAPDQCVNFRALIISKCQNQFITNKVDENVLKLEKELAECTDPAKKKELHLQLEEENRRVRMRSVGNVRFIGELYKLKMLTAKIMVYCMTYLIEKLEEEKLECLCKLLTTIGEQVESEVKEQLESVFKKMQDIVERKSNKISSRVRFMLQDVIELRRRKWVAKNVVDSQPKMMDQIQKEAEQHQRHIELMNAPSMGGGGFRREDGGRGKRGGDRRQGSNSFMDNQWKPTRPTNYTVDTSKLKTVAQKNLSNIKLAPQNSGWNHGSGTKTPAQINSNLMISLTKNMYSVLENVQADPTSLRTNKDLSSSYHHSKSIERSTFNSRGDFNSGSGSRSGSVGVTRSNSSSRSATTAPAPAPVSEAAPVAPAPQEPLPDAKKKFVKILIMDKLVNPNDDEFITEIKQTFPPQYHAAVVTEILNIALERAAKDVYSIAKSLFHLVSTGTISSDNFLAGINEILEFAPDLYIDIPILYEYLGKFIAPNIEKRHITFVQVFRLCENIIMSNQGHMFLKTVIRDLKESMGPSFVKTKWQESGLELKQWMPEEQVPKWIEDNKFEFLEGGKPTEETKKILTPSETQSKLLQLMNTDEHCDCIRGWVQDNLGAASNENWFMRALTQAVCEYALYGTEGRDVPHFSHERMNKYASLISEFGDSREQREASCLFGIQQLIHRLEHPQGLTLEIFQYLHEQYIISVEGFIAWEVSEKEPEGKAVMLKALTSFFTNIKEADNEESCGED
ncbi:eukaryotic translation initiation factor 4 gamma 3-like isoform X5 [Vanessa cardui]|uniref:eukaryotic translation initiation factor 4 gamma 3-like isoform X5 n=1 Tax=Vanessa cardui TaxID=171605 RepID=UPI001F13764A|nr:eukaryotic translation initiation factor 4 gamma 3-like isoform X5 [Vanessa cardui]